MSASTVLPTVQRAIIASEKLNYTISDDAPTPTVSAGRILIKTEAIGLNPVDTKMVGPFVTAGASYGTDCAGVVVALSPDVEAAGRLKIGDRVAGLADGMEGLRPQGGAFGEYVCVDGGMAFKMPDSMTMAEGASMPLRVATASMALFHALGLDPKMLETPTTEKLTVLVYGGATSTGTMAIQLLKKCGVTVLTTCSPSSQDLVESFGADTCFDYNDPNCGDEIRKHTGSALDYALDCITTESSAMICYQALGRCGGKYVGLEPLPEATKTRKAVTPDWILVSWLNGQKVSWPLPFGTDGKPEAQAFAESFFPLIHKLFTGNWFKLHPIRVEAGGFEGLLDGVNLVRNGKVRGSKLVYFTADRKPKEAEVETKGVPMDQLASLPAVAISV